MKRNPVMLCAMIMIVQSICAHAQSGDPESSFESPKASSMNRFGEYPVSLFTGLVDITIPVYEISLNGIVVPVEFRYHASGMRYDDQSLELGLGWSLMCGGVLSHTVRGEPSPYIPDTQVPRSVSAIDPRGLGSVDPECGNIYLERVARGQGDFENYNPTLYSCNQIDGETDLFTYTLPTASGVFAWHHRTGAINIPNRPFQFQIPYNRIIDENGISYIFGKVESYNFSNNGSRYLTEIISADKSDTVRFIYSDTGSPSVMPTLYGITAGEQYSLIGANSGSRNLSYYSSERIMPSVDPLFSHSVNPPVLTEVIYRGGRISFLYDGTDGRTLNRISIYSAGSLNRIINVSQSSYNQNNSSARKLDMVSFCDSSGNVEYRYSFDYYGSPVNLEGKDGFDYWGYLNGAVNGTSQIPLFTRLYCGATTQIGGADRSPDSQSSRMGMLKRVTYPAGGYTEYEYEGHKAGGVILGGQRIRSVRYFDSAGDLLDRRTYVYGANGDGNGVAKQYLVNNGVLNINVDDYMRSFKSIVRSDHEGYSMTLVSSYSYLDRFSPFPSRSYVISGSSAVYPHVTEYYGTEQNNIGKVEYVYEYVATESPYLTYRGRTPEYSYRTYDWKNGSLVSRKTYDSSGTLVNLEETVYGSVREEEIYNIRVSSEVSISGGSNPYSVEEVYVNFSDPDYSTDFYPYQSIIGNSRFDFFNYYSNTGLYVPVSKRTVQDGVSHMTHYRYNTLGQCILKSEMNSAGDSVFVRYSYPLEESPSLLSYNPSALISTSTISGGELVDSVRMSYSPSGVAHRLSSISSWNNATEQMEARTVYGNHDLYGNPGSAVKDGIYKVVYIWGYQGKHLVAEIRNADYATVMQYLGSSLISRVLQSPLPSSSDMAAIESIRNVSAFSTAQVFTCSYIPGKGISSVTDPSGLTTTYEYDSFGNLSCVKDHDGRVMSIYDIHYLNN